MSPTIDHITHRDTRDPQTLDAMEARDKGYLSPWTHASSRQTAAPPLLSLADRPVISISTNTPRGGMEAKLNSSVIRNSDTNKH